MQNHSPYPGTCIVHWDREITKRGKWSIRHEEVGKSIDSYAISSFPFSFEVLRKLGSITIPNIYESQCTCDSVETDG